MKEDQRAIKLAPVILLAVAFHLMFLPAYAKGEFGFGHSTKLTRIRPIRIRLPRVRTFNSHFRFGKYSPPPSPPPATTPGPTVDVTQFGAAGDGKTDNWQAIQKALNAAPNGTIYFPPGTYLVSAPIVLNARSASGAGPSSQIVGTFRDSGFKSGIFMPVGKCTISNLSINTAGVALGANQGVLVTNTQGPVTINQVQIVGQFYNDVMIWGASNVTVTNCTLANTFPANAGGPGVILLANSSTVWIANNVFTNQTSAQSVGTINCFPLKSLTGTSNVTISGNSFQGTGSLGSYIFMTFISGLNITGNTFSYPQYQGSQVGYGGSPGAITLNGTLPGSTGPVANVQITNNNFQYIQPVSYPAGNNAAVTITGQGSGSVENVVLISNTFKQYPAPGWNCSLSIAATVTGAPGSIQSFSAIGNTIDGAAYAGLWVDSTTNIAIQNNNISNCYGPGILTNTNAGGSLTISNNALTNCGLAPPTSSLVKNLGLSLLGDIIVQSASQITAATISNNSYGTAAQANNLQYNIYCALSKSVATVTGNTNQTLLPNYGPL